MASNAFYQAFVEIVPEGSKILPTLNKQMAGAGSKAGQNAGESINKGILGSLGSLAAPIAATIAGLGIGRLLSDSINNASDFQEAGTAVTAVFGDADKTIQNFAKNAATTLGQSTNMTLDAARVFGTFGKAAGLAGEDLAGFSTDFITLAADLASFNNTTPEQAIEALGAGLRGESEPLRAYGVLLDDAALKARATELDIYSGTGALTQQQKVLASQAEILAQTSTQQGDFAKTSGGLANQQRILSAGLANLSSSFGRLLLPAMLKVVGFLNRTVLPVLDKASATLEAFFAKATPAAKGLYDLLSKGDFTAGLREATGLTEDSPLVDFLLTVRDKAIEAGAALKENLGPVFDGFGDAITPLIPKLIDLYTQFSPFSVILTAITPLLPALASILTSLGDSLGIFLGAIVDALPEILPALGELAVALGGSLAEALTTIAPELPEIAQSLSDMFTAILPLLPALISLIPPLLQLAVAVLPLLLPVLQFVADELGSLFTAFGVVLDFLSGDLDVGAFLASILQVGGGIGVAVNFIINAFNQLQANILAVKQWFVDMATGVQTEVDRAVGFVTGLPGRVLEGLGNLGGTLLQSGKDLIQGFIDGINEMFPGLDGAVGGVMDFVGGFFPNSPAKRGQFSGSGWTNLKHSGEAIGQQFGRGLSGSTTGLGIGNVAIPNVSSTVAGVAGSGATRGPGGAPITQIINGAPGQSPETIARISKDALKFELGAVG